MSDTSLSSVPFFRTVASLRAHISNVRRAGRSIGFVPTMGALHAGHASLIEAAARAGHFVVVSIYVNPTQFGPNEDFTAYPRSIEADAAICRDSGADAIFAPNDAEMYPPGEETRVRPGPLADRMCGRFRPGHFEGVCTVVAKLFNFVQPDVAYFGQKDAQQARILGKMVDDLGFPVRLVVCPIVREPDGLAMSSRNSYLSPTERSSALCLYHALSLGRDRLAAGEKDLAAIVRLMQEEVHRVAGVRDGHVTIDYIEINDPDSLMALTAPGKRMLLAGAIRIGRTRLIDNLLVTSD
ncbi:MAG: pantoate--beta-alanine ligase [Phycisphaerae bacterium]|nr:pantoate--beta-alanine ligase [Phycisphaerae bacterium]